LRLAPELTLNVVTSRSVHWYAMSEDLANPESRMTMDGGRIRLDWKRSNWSAHEGLLKTFKERLRAPGYPIVVSKPFDRCTPSHQCGTVRVGRAPSAVVRPSTHNSIRADPRRITTLG
jgi:choline dehydrogenase-like flavoprotein